MDIGILMSRVCICVCLHVCMRVFMYLGICVKIVYIYIYACVNVRRFLGPICTEFVSYLDEEAQIS